ncbi:MAG: ribosome maturation factor RimP [Pseudomonadota bacterium]
MKTKKKHSKTLPSETGSKPFSRETQTLLVSRVSALAETLCDAEGMELVFVEFLREPAGRILRIYIDKPGGLSLNDCVSVSRQLGDILDVDLENLGPYSLEVSSPGLERPLWKVRDYDRFKGRVAKIRIRVAVENQKNFKGILLGVTDEIVTLRVEGTERTVAIPFKDIARARLVEH